MINDQRKCPKCESRMEVGFTMAQNPKGMWRVKVDAEATWHPGRRHYSLFGLIQSTEQPFKIDTYRCVKCGYLESYAITAPHPG